MGCGKQARNCADNDEWIKAVYDDARFKTNRHLVKGKTAFQSDDKSKSSS